MKSPIVPLARLGTLLVGAWAFLMVPLTAFAADTTGVLAPGATCDGKSLMKAAMGFDFVSAKPEFCAAVGGALSTFIFTALNALLLALMFILALRVAAIFWGALNEIRKPDAAYGNDNAEQKILRSALIKAIETFAIGLIGFVAIENGADLLLGVANTFGDTLCTTNCSNTQYLAKYFGPFSGILGIAQNLASYGALLMGLWVIGTTFLSQLQKQEMGAVDKGKSTANLQAAIKRAAIAAVLSIAAFVAIRQGPMTFDSVLSGTKGVVQNTTNGL